jgi:DUF971 family protein
MNDHTRDISNTPIPTKITLHQNSHTVELHYANGSTYHLSFEYLRVHSPSAEVRGHHGQQGVLQTGKRSVVLKSIKPVGHYAIQLIFSDGHTSGIYTWAYLHKLATRHDALWQAYLEKLALVGASRDDNDECV